MTPDHLHAAISDLSSEMCRYGNGADERLRKIVCFCNTSLVLHERLEACDRAEAGQLLGQIAQQHGLPNECVLIDPNEQEPK